MSDLYHYSPVSRLYKKVRRIIKVEKPVADEDKSVRIITAGMEDGTIERDYSSWFRRDKA